MGTSQSKQQEYFGGANIPNEMLGYIGEFADEDTRVRMRRSGKDAFLVRRDYDPDIRVFELYKKVQSKLESLEGESQRDELRAMVQSYVQAVLERGGEMDKIRYGILLLASGSNDALIYQMIVDEILTFLVENRYPVEARTLQNLPIPWMLTNDYIRTPSFMGWSLGMERDYGRPNKKRWADLIFTELGF